jgi:hypothetical protein
MAGWSSHNRRFTFLGGTLNLLTFKVRNDTLALILLLVSNNPSCFWPQDVTSRGQLASDPELCRNGMLPFCYPVLG